MEWLFFGETLTSIFFSVSCRMGVRGFYKWLKDTKKYKPRTVKLSDADSLLIDFKLMLNKIMSGVPSDAPDVANLCATKIDRHCRPFLVVVFVNDGDKHIPNLKSDTLSKRIESKRICAQKAHDEEEKLCEFVRKRKIAALDVPDQVGDDSFIQSNFELDHEQHLMEKKVESRKRQARRITVDFAKEVLAILQTKGYITIQCEGEADHVLMLLAKGFTYVVSEDSDLLVGGVDNLLRYFGTTNELYSNIFSVLDITPQQLKILSAFAGCDYTTGLPGLGLKKAETYLKKYKSVRKFLASDDAAKFEGDPSFERIVKQVVHLFSPKLAVL
jgi:5'-3' exonuclease